MPKGARRNNRTACKAKVAPAAINGERMSIRMRQSVLKLILILVSMMIAGLSAIVTFGCEGDNTPTAGNTPTAIVEKYYQLLKEKDCQRLADYINDKEPELVERRVNDCPQVADRLVSYSITREMIDENGFFARVDIEVTIKENGKEKTNSTWQHLAKVGDDWKLTSIP